MEKEQFESALKDLAAEKPCFLSENEFQIALAEKLAKFEREIGHENACAYLDQNKKIKDAKRTINPDIVVTEGMFSDDKYEEGQDLVYVECKYKACGKYISDRKLVRQSSAKAPARNITRYQFWEDIERMELVDKGRQDRPVKKYVILLTNDKSYWTVKANDVTRSDYEFSLHNDRGDVPQEMVYHTTKNGAPANKAIKLQGTYVLEADAWKPYGNTEFKYLLVEVIAGQ